MSPSTDPFSALPKKLANKVTKALGHSPSSKSLTKTSTRLRAFIKDTLRQHERLAKKTSSGAKKSKRLDELLRQASVACEAQALVDNAFNQLLTVMISDRSSRPKKSAQKNVLITRKLLTEAATEIFLSAKSLRESCSLKGKIIDSGQGEEDEILRLEKLSQKLDALNKSKA